MILGGRRRGFIQKPEVRGQRKKQITTETQSHRVIGTQELWSVGKSGLQRTLRKHKGVLRKVRSKYGHSHLLKIKMPPSGRHFVFLLPYTLSIAHRRGE